MNFFNLQEAHLSFKYGGGASDNGLGLNRLLSAGTAVVETGVTGTTLPPSVTATGISTAASLTPSGLFLTFSAS